MLIYYKTIAFRTAVCYNIKKRLELAMDIRKELFKLQDVEYREFHSRLMPGVSKEKIIGIRIPIIREFARKIKNTPYACEFLSNVPHEYYEEDNLHAFLISEIKNFDRCITELERFLPFIDNWATCDSLRPKCFKLNTDRLKPYIYKWIESGKAFVVRFGIEMLMVHYLDEHFDLQYLYRVSKIKNDEYYVNMMIAWYFATALAKQYEAAVPFLERSELPAWVHNKTIQKAKESNRISSETKKYLESLKLKSAEI